MSSYTFIIVGKNDNPIYEAEFSSGQKQQRDTSNQLSQFIIHSSLDIVEETVWKANTMYMKVVDRYGKQFISAFVTAGHMKFMLLHDKKEEDAIKNFFTDVHELYIKVLLNPFYVVNSTITSQTFDVRVKKLAAKYF